MKSTGQILLIKELKFLGREDPEKLSWMQKALSRRGRSQCDEATAEQKENHRRKNNDKKGSHRRYKKQG